MSKPNCLNTIDGQTLAALVLIIIVLPVLMIAAVVSRATAKMGGH